MARRETFAPKKEAQKEVKRERCGSIHQQKGQHDQFCLYFAILAVFRYVLGVFVA
jgi:hypothetical protein